MIRSKLFVLFILLTPWFLRAQTVTKLTGITAANDPHPEHDVDPNGAIGTKQYLEWTNVAFWAWDKVTLKPLSPSPTLGTKPWTDANLTSCESIGGDGLVLFDRLASRWIIAAHSNKDTSGNYYFCVAVSSTDDLASSTLTWYAYEFLLNSAMGGNYFPDWPKIGTWPDAYYVGMDLLNPAQKYAYVGVLACALDRTNMLTGGTPRQMQCVRYTGTDPYLWHSLIPGDVEGTTAPPTGQDEFFVSIQNPPRDGKTTTSNSINLWDFQLDTSWQGNSKLVQSSLTVPTYTPGCYDPTNPSKAICIPQPTGPDHLTSIGDRLMPRSAYRNFGTYQSFLVSQTVGVSSSTKQTGIRWYELRGSGTPTLYQSGTVSLDTSTYRFMPSIAQDHVGDAAVGYSVSSGKLRPGIRAASWSLVNNTKPVEVNIQNGAGSQENSPYWGDYTSMTVDPVDDCTFWYVNENLPSNETGKSINWVSKIAKFSLSNCQ
jgi:hypothetical protein